MFSHVCHGLAELNKRVEQTPCEVLGETLLKMVETMTQQFCCMSMCFLFESPFFPGQTAFFCGSTSHTCLYEETTQHRDALSMLQHWKQ